MNFPTEQLLQSKTPITFYPIPNLSKYLITKQGLILSTITNSIISPYVDCVGYWTVSVINDNNSKCNLSLHRLLANTFIENKDNLPEVNHIDGNKLNNNLDNLEWVTGCQNVRHAFTTGLCNRQSLCNYDNLQVYIDRLLNDPQCTFSSLSRELGLDDMSSLRKLLKRDFERNNKHNEWVALTKIVAKKGRTNIVVEAFIQNAWLSFDSSRELAKFLGASPAAVCRGLKNNKTVKGIQVRYAKTN